MPECISRPHKAGGVSTAQLPEGFLTAQMIQKPKAFRTHLGLTIPKPFSETEISNAEVFTSSVQNAEIILKPRPQMTEVSSA
ncbi:hypothetical protein Nepgr_008075 [Nepenthes gracilis]|uniref:Uncharacterized protein n=1 Tax=Nepenthes gracilis TaxID=150966 RepID=A0AAD3S893_NEPGR|nr:hypothetical protein Nepgr_008075 [Nepenthes gracilis]